MTVTARVNAGALIRLDRVFGIPATSLDIAFGDVDAGCIATPPPGLSCGIDGSGDAVWYGDVQFAVFVRHLSLSTSVSFTGQQQAGGTIPAGALLDGSSSTMPAIAYPIAPAAPMVVVGGIPIGFTPIVRSFGLRVRSTDAPIAWTGQTVYTLVVE